MQRNDIQTQERQLSRRSKTSIADILEALEPSRYFERIGFGLYPWQEYVFNLIAKGCSTIAINGARQAGKSTIVAGLPVQAESRFSDGKKNNYSLVFASSEDQASLVIRKAYDFIIADKRLSIDTAGSDHIVFGTGGTIKALPSTEKTVRGHSSPLFIIMDEAARMPDELVYAVSPMTVDNPKCSTVYISTPAGKRGVFWHLWNNPSIARVEVKAPWDIIRDSRGPRIVRAEPEEAYQAHKAKEGIAGFYSPRHHSLKFMTDQLDLMGERWVRQEYLCEFVESEDSVFRYDDIDRAIEAGKEVVPLFSDAIPIAETLFAGGPE